MIGFLKKTSSGRNLFGTELS